MVLLRIRNPLTGVQFFLSAPCSHSIKVVRPSYTRLSDRLSHGPGSNPGGSTNINRHMIVWILREPRSGSTAFSDHVAKHLNRTHKFVQYPSDLNEVLNTRNPEDYVFSSHSFNFLEIMESYPDPVLLIRCTRRDKTDQCISYLLGQWINNAVDNTQRFWNIKRDNSLNTNIKTFENAEPTFFTKKDVAGCLTYYSKMETNWNRYSSAHQNFTVFYEDLCLAGVDVPPIGLHSYRITTQDSFTLKLPDYKDKLCLNHGMIRNWINEHYNAQMVEW